MKANYNRSKARLVDEYLDKTIGSRSNRSFVNNNIDDIISFKDQSRFHMEKSAGVLEIEMDKAENSEDAYLAVKSMCEGIKGIVTTP